MQEIVIRSAISKDLPVIEYLEKCSFPDPWSPSTLSQHVLKGPGYYLVGSLDDKVVGFLCLWFVADEVQIVRVATDPAFRRKGIATALIKRGIAEARDRKAVYLYLDVRESNEVAICLYRKLGFDVLGKREGLYEKPLEAGYTMAIDFRKETEDEAISD